MPQPPSELRLLPEVLNDLQSIQRHNPDHADRILRKINDWREKIAWGRVPQDHLTYLSGSADYNFYRERVGNSGYRIIYEISGDVMTAGCGPSKERLDVRPPRIQAAVGSFLTVLRHATCTSTTRTVTRGLEGSTPPRQVLLLQPITRHER